MLFTYRKIIFGASIRAHLFFLYSQKEAAAVPGTDFADGLLLIAVYTIYMILLRSMYECIKDW
jgi:hypothetical protein